MTTVGIWYVNRLNNMEVFMAVVIGSATSVDFGGACVISAQWGFNPNNQDAFCLDGEGDPIDSRTTFKPEKTLSLTLYAPGPTYLTPRSKHCDNSSSISATVSPGACSGTITNISDNNWVVTAYSYSKETRDSVAQESWSLVRYLGFGVGSATILTAPTSILRVSSQGQSSIGGQTGIVFSKVITTASSGSVSVGGLGKADDMQIGTVSQVGGGGGVTATPAGTGSAQMVYNPVYI